MRFICISYYYVLQHQRAFLKHWRDLQPLWLCVHDTPTRCHRCSLGQELRVQFSHHSWGANVLHFMTSHFVSQYPGERKRTLTIKDSCSQEGESRNPPEVEKKIRKGDEASTPPARAMDSAGWKRGPVCDATRFNKRHGDNVPANGSNHRNNALCSLLTLTTMTSR